MAETSILDTPLGGKDTEKANPFKYVESGSLEDRHSLLKTPKEDTIPRKIEEMPGISKTFLKSSLEASKENKCEKSILVIVNPNSGKKKAKQIFKKELLPLLESFDCSYDLLVTSRANQAKLYVADYPLLAEDYFKIATVSGDGLLHEVYQGLASRPDWSEALKIPVGMIPAGSGNGLVRSIAHFQNEQVPKGRARLRESAEAIMENSTAPMDLACVQTSSGQVFLSFLSLGYGMVSDTDIESERLRFLGPFRFGFWGLRKLISGKSYRAKLHFRQFRNDGQVAESGNAFNVKSAFRELPDISEPIPDSPQWTVVEDEFSLVYVVSKPWITNSACFAPQYNSLNDGTLWLIMIRKVWGRKALFRFLLTLERAGHTEVPEIEMVPVTAIRLEPRTKGYITVDGEAVDFGNLQAEILPSLGNTLVGKPRQSKKSV